MDRRASGERESMTRVPGWMELSSYSSCYFLDFY